LEVHKDPHLLADLTNLFHFDHGSSFENDGMKHNIKYYKKLTKQVWVQGPIHKDLLAPTHQRENPPFLVGWNTSTY
jgi:hypothetical protein